MIYIFSVFLLLMPWSRDPINAVSFSLPLATIFGGFTIIPLFFINFTKHIRYIRTHSLVFLIFCYCLLSYLIGIWNLDQIDHSYLYLKNGEIISYLVIGAKKLVQVFFVTIIFYEISSFSQEKIAFFRKYWIVGFYISLLVHVIIYFTRPPDFLPRAGTFDEGNFAGLYYVLTFCIMISDLSVSFRKKIFYMIACATGIILSASTIGMIVFLANVAVLFMTKQTLLTKLKAAILAIFFITVAIVFNVNSVYDKLFSENINSGNFSKYDRIQSIKAGAEIFIRYPLGGLGIETYGFLANDFLDQSEFKFYDNTFRRIPNNVYIEVLSQLGLFGLSLFMYFFWRLIKKTKETSQALLGGIISILIYWLAFPSFSVTYVWVYLGYCSLFHMKKQLAISSGHLKSSKMIEAEE